jgi:PST family polysaccharide transporter
LGIYNRAFAMVIMPFNQLLAPLGNVALTSLSRARHDGRDIYPMLLKAQVAISAFLTFMFVLAGSLAGPAVHFALGAAWAESAALLSILSIGGAVQVLSNILFWAFVASGNAKHLLLCAMITKPLLVACVALGSVYGIHGIAWGYSIGLIISWFIQLAWLKRCDDLPVWRFLRSGFYVMLCGLIAGGTAWAFIEQTGAYLSQSALLVVGFAIVTTTYLPLLMANARIRRLLLQIIGPAYARIRLF